MEGTTKAKLIALATRAAIPEGKREGVFQTLMS